MQPGGSPLWVRARSFSGFFISSSSRAHAMPPVRFEESRTPDSITATVAADKKDQADHKAREADTGSRVRNISHENPGVDAFGQMVGAPLVRSMPWTRPEQPGGLL